MSALPTDLQPAPPDIIAVVGRLITTHFPHLATARIAVLVRDRAPEAEDEPGFDGPNGRANKVTVAATGVNTNDPSLPFEYVLWFALDAWQVMNGSDREAIVFHELMHAGRDEQGRPQLTPHDAGVFTQEVELYGTWWADAQARFRNARKGERE